MKGHDRATLEYYSGAVERMSGAAYDREWALPIMKRFAAALPKGAMVLELGCGAGQDAAALIDLGLDVEATDGCPELAKAAGLRLGRPVRVMRFDELDANERYYGVWASATLLHVLRDDLVEVLGRIHRAIKPGGMFYASFKTGRAAGRDKFGRYFNYPSDAELRDYLARSGAWTVTEMTKNQGYGSDGVLTDWLHFLAERG